MRGRKLTRTVYAQVVAVVLVSLGMAGLAGVVGTARPADLFHVAVGAIFAHLGFFQRNTIVVRGVIGCMGVLVLLVKGVVILTPLLWGEPPFHGPVEVTCVVVS